MKREEISKAVGSMSMRHVYEAQMYSVEKKIRKFETGIFRQTVAAAVLLICAFMVCRPIAAGSLSGYFHDLIRWDGAVTGLEYQDLAGETKVDVSRAVLENDRLSMSVKIIFPDTKEPPFGSRYMSQAAIGDYKIMDREGNVVAASKNMQEETIQRLEEDRSAEFRLTVDGKDFGRMEEYVLAVESVYAVKKADAPLKIEGNWKCRFQTE